MVISPTSIVSSPSDRLARHLGRRLDPEALEERRRDVRREDEAVRPGRIRGERALEAFAGDPDRKLLVLRRWRIAHSDQHVVALERRDRLRQLAGLQADDAHAGRAGAAAAALGEPVDAPVLVGREQSDMADQRLGADVDSLLLERLREQSGDDVVGRAFGPSDDLLPDPRLDTGVGEEHRRQLLVVEVVEDARALAHVEIGLGGRHAATYAAREQARRKTLDPGESRDRRLGGKRGDDDARFRRRGCGARGRGRKQRQGCENERDGGPHVREVHVLQGRPCLAAARRRQSGRRINASSSPPARTTPRTGRCAPTRPWAHAATPTCSCSPRARSSTTSTISTSSSPSPAWRAGRRSPTPIWR